VFYATRIKARFGSAIAIAGCGGYQTMVQNYLRLAQDIGWLLLVILTPLLVNVYGQQPFELPKVLLVRTLVWLLAALVVAEHILARRSLWRTLQANPLCMPVALLAVVIVITSVTAADWRLALWGSAARSQGALTLLTYLLLFLLAAHRLRRRAAALQVVWAMVVGGIPLLSFSLLQVNGWNPFGMVTDARAPIYATMGRANFVAAYLVMLLPLTLALLLTATRRNVRLAWAALFVGQLLGIGVTLSRSAWLAAFGALGTFVLLWWGTRLAQHWRRLAWGGLALLCLGGPLVVLWFGPQDIGSIAARWRIWQGTWTLIAQRPLLGFGADNLGLIFPRVYPPELVYVQGRDFFVDRAHNFLLDWVVIGGIPGLLAYLMLIISFSRVMLQALPLLRCAQTRALLIAGLAAVLGNEVNNLLSFDVTATAMATWLLMGMGMALVAPPVAQRAVEGMPLSRWRWGAVGLLGVGVACVVWQANARPLLADIAAHTANREAQQGEWDQVLAARTLAVAAWPEEPDHHLRLSQAYYRKAVDDPASAQFWLVQAETSLLVAHTLRPNEVAIWLHLAQFYTNTAVHFGSETLGLADEAYAHALLLAPNHAGIYVARGRLALDMGDPERAVGWLRHAVVLDASHGEAYLALGVAELALGRGEIALADFLEAVRLMPQSEQAYGALADAYLRLGQIPEALRAAEIALDLDPHSVRAHAIRQAIDNVAQD
jgi:O-antigen ligase